MRGRLPKSFYDIVKKLTKYKKAVVIAQKFDETSLIEQGLTKDYDFHQYLQQLYHDDTAPSDLSINMENPTKPSNDIKGWSYPMPQVAPNESN